MKGGVVAEFYAEFLHPILRQTVFADNKECTECGSVRFFRAHLSPDICNEIRELYKRLNASYGPAIIIYAVARLVRLEY